MARRWEPAAGETRPSDGPATAGGAGEGEGGGTGEAALAGCAAVFLPARPPRAGKVAFWRPDGGPLPDLATGGGEGASDKDGAAEPGRLTVARRHGNGARSRTVPAVLLPTAEAVPLLVRARHDPAAHPAAACWGAATLHALHLAARGRLLPGLTLEDTDAWRAGPLDPEDIAHLRAIAAAMPADAYAVPIPDSRPLQVTDPAVLVRLYVDAVVDALPRTPAAGMVAGAPYAASAPQHLPGAREWAAEVAAGVDAGVRLSLRLDIAPHKLFDAAEASGAGNT
ncbi:ATP-dependent helicase, partial [Streptomyces nigrescens]